MQAFKSCFNKTCNNLRNDSYKIRLHHFIPLWLIVLLIAGVHEHQKWAQEQYTPAAPSPQIGAPL